MAKGNKTFKGLAVPLMGESEIIQTTAGDDLVTLTGASGQTGDFLVGANSSGTEKFSIDASGNLVLAGTITSSGKAAAPIVSLGSVYSAVPTTGLTKGDIFAVFAAGGTAPNLGICYSTATNAVRLATFNTETLGRLT